MLFRSNVFPPAEQGRIRTMLSTSLIGVVSQQLVRRSDGKGRVAALEVMVNTPAIGNLIREGTLAPQRPRRFERAPGFHDCFPRRRTAFLAAHVQQQCGRTTSESA